MERAVPPFFLVGNPRSGTKMLRELLNASPAVWMSEVESHFIPKFTRGIDRYGNLADLDGFARLAGRWHDDVDPRLYYQIIPRAADFGHPR